MQLTTIPTHFSIPLTHKNGDFAYIKVLWGILNADPDFLDSFVLKNGRASQQTKMKIVQNVGRSKETAILVNKIF